MNVKDADTDPAGIELVLARARRKLHRVGPETAAELQHEGGLIVDVRPMANRREEGEIPGAVIVERIVLEWRLDPSCEHRIEGLRAERPIVLVCNEGYSSSLAAASLRDCGLRWITDLVGGFRAWSAAGLPVVAGGSAAVT